MILGDDTRGSDVFVHGIGDGGVGQIFIPDVNCRWSVMVYGAVPSG